MDCPICGGFDKDNYFKCPECNRDFICGKHYDANELVCSECAEKHKSKSEVKSSQRKIQVGESPPSEDSVEKEQKTPFYFKNVVCPICGALTRNRLFKPKIYSEKKIDIDKHVLSFGWGDPDFNSYYPPLYFFWHCNNCRYTAEQSDFEGPTKNPWSNFKLIKKVYPEKLQDDKSTEKLVSWLGKGINYDQMNYPMAFKIHLLGIYVQEVLAPEERDLLKLGRYYIRTGWLLRELNEKKSKELEIVNNIANELKKIWKDIPLEESGFLLKALDYLNDAYVKHPSIKNAAAAVDMLFWLAGIYLKIEDQQKGLNYLNNVIQEGQKQKAKIEERLKNPKITEDEEKNLFIQSKKISINVSKARDLIQDIQYQKFLAQKAEAKKIIDTMVDNTPEEQREILTQKGFTTKVLDAVVPDKKKKLFGLFG